MKRKVVYDAQEVAEQCSFTRSRAIMASENLSEQTDKLSDYVGHTMAVSIAIVSEERDAVDSAESSYRFWCKKVTPGTKMKETSQGEVSILELAPGKPMIEDIKLGEKVKYEGADYSAQGKIFKVTEVHSTYIVIERKDEFGKKHKEFVDEYEIVEDPIDKYR